VTIVIISGTGRAGRVEATESRRFRHL